MRFNYLKHTVILKCTIIENYHDLHNLDIQNKIKLYIATVLLYIAIHIAIPLASDYKKPVSY